MSGYHKNYSPLRIELNEAKTAIIGLVVLGVVWQYLADPPTKIMTLIVVAISGLGGYEIRKQVERMRVPEAVSLGQEPPPWWHRYYFRVIGIFLAFGGGGLVFDELIHGPLSFWPLTNHEVYGVILGLFGLYLISLEPHGK